MNTSRNTAAFIGTFLHAAKTLCSAVVLLAAAAGVGAAEDQRVFPGTQLFINNHRAGASNGASGDFGKTGEWSCGHPGHVSLVTWSYDRSTGDADVYTVSRTYPAGLPTAKTETREFTYKGGVLRLWEDDFQKILLRPKFGKRAFGPLEFGMSRDEWMQKMSDISRSTGGSPILAAELQQYLLGGRGPVSTRKPDYSTDRPRYFVGAVPFSKDERLRAVAARASGENKDAYSSSVATAWSDLRKVAQDLFGDPISDLGMPPLESLKGADPILVTTIWQKDGVRAELGMELYRPYGDDMAIGANLTVTKLELE